MRDPEQENSQEDQTGKDAAGAHDHRISWSDFIEQLGHELRAMAASAVSGWSQDDGQSPTAIVHELWLRLAGQKDLKFESREAFLAYASAAVRNILIDDARRRLAIKRGGNRAQVPLDGVDRPTLCPPESLVDLDDELRRLETIHPRSARVVEMRFFGGMTDAEIARQLGINPRTVRGDWATARAWLRTRLDDGKANHINL